MKRFSGSLLAGAAMLLLSAAGAQAAAFQAKASAPAASAAAPLAAATDRGRLLVAITRAGIIATQDMLANVPDPEAAGVAGWIAQPQGNAMLVTFYARGEEGPAAVYRATVLGARVTDRDVHLEGERPLLDPIQARMAAARDATESLEHRACTDLPFNTLVVPPADAEAPVDVYQVSAQAKKEEFPIGGHFLSTIAADGSVARTRSFANGCNDLAVADPPEGQQPQPLGVTHLLDPLPTEMHLLLSFMARRPLLVVAGEPQKIWIVTPERIAEVRDRPTADGDPVGR